MGRKKLTTKTHKPVKRKRIRKKQKFVWLAKTLVILAAFEFMYFGFLNYEYDKQVMASKYIANNVAAKFSTELYFEDPGSLPAQVDLLKEEKFRFTLVNKEGKPMVYSYKAYIDTQGNKKIIQENEIALKNNEAKTIEVKYRLVFPIERSQVFVKLVPSMQNIHFWID